MDLVINVLVASDILLAILLVVVGMAQMDSRYARRVRAENTRKAILRGEQRDRH